MEPVRWHACVLRLEAQTGGVVPKTHGQQVHGLFLDVVRSVDPSLAELLHAGQRRRPFTLSPFEGLPPVGAAGGHALRRGATASVRVTLLDSTALSGFLAALISEAAHRTVRLGAIPFTITSLATYPDQHPWAGTTSPRELLDTDATDDEITLRFVTPTAFSLGDRPGAGKMIEPLPRPEFVFGGLLRAWNAFGDQPLSPSLRSVVGEQMVVSRFDLRSELYRFRNHMQVGAVGTCTYEFKGAVSPDVRRQIHALARAAAYLGVGYRTTMGMGQTRLLTVRGPNEPG